MPLTSILDMFLPLSCSCSKRSLLPDSTGICTTPHHTSTSSLPLITGFVYLQLGLWVGTRGSEDRLELGGLHDITLDLQLAAHEESLCVGLAGHQLAKVLLRERKSDY